MNRLLTLRGKNLRRVTSERFGGSASNNGDGIRIDLARSVCYSQAAGYGFGMKDLTRSVCYSQSTADTEFRQKDLVRSVYYSLRRRRALKSENYLRRLGRSITQIGIGDRGQEQVN
jgi:hypothetical protein